MNDLRLFASIDEAVQLARRSTGLQVEEADLHRLASLGVLTDFGTTEATFLAEQVYRLGGCVFGTAEIGVGLFLRARAPANIDWSRHVVLHISPHLAVSFEPDRFPSFSIQSFLVIVRDRLAGINQDDEWNAVVTEVVDGLCIWANQSVDPAEWSELWHIVNSANARTVRAEANCVPSIYGNKARLSHFIVSVVRQWMPSEVPICDLMSGTGLVTRKLLADRPVFANDVAPFAQLLTESQVISVAEAGTTRLAEQLLPLFNENVTTLAAMFQAALDVEERFLFGGLDGIRLAEYARFSATCTRFVPGFEPAEYTDSWSRSLDSELRQQVAGLVEQRRRDGGLLPYVLTTAYWGNCYFGLRQAIEIDSLRYAIDGVSDERDRQVLIALLFAVADACASGPHFAQPPRTSSERQIKRLLERRARSVFREFTDRLCALPLRPSCSAHGLRTTRLPWREALQDYLSHTEHIPSRAVYVDPPYSRLQYSRYYHVFDTLLRYDYPGCIHNGRVSELEKRFTSKFDSRPNSAAAELGDVIERVSDAGATLFLSYSTGASVPLESIHEKVRAAFSKVAVYTSSIQHHSQGRPIGRDSRRIEVIFVGVKK